MSNSNEAWADVLMQLMPRGRAWPRETSSDLYQLILAIAARYRRAEFNSEKLLSEMRPESTLQLLSDWEEYLGLPDCSVIGDSVESRRVALVEKYHRKGGLWAAKIESLLAAFGITAIVEEQFPHHCMRSCTYPLISNVYRHITVVSVASIPSSRFTCLDTVNVPLNSDMALLVECLLNQYKMAGRSYEINYV